MKISQACLDLIKEFEGFSTKAYICPAGKPTISYGLTRYADGRAVRIGDKLSTAQAKNEFMKVLQHYINAVNSKVQVVLTQHQFDALVSFCFNVGVGSFSGSTLLRKLNKGDYKGAARELLRWNKATVKGKSVILPGLTRRRQAEKKLFETEGSGIGTKAEATWLKLVAVDKKFKVIAYRGSEKVREDILDSPHKGDLIDLLNSYPNANSVLP